MGLPIDLTTVRLFLRVFLAAILWSAAISKLAHPRRFRRGIQEYQVIPAFLEKTLFLSTLLSFSIPSMEILVGFGLISGMLLALSSVLTTGLFCLFGIVVAFNLLRGRKDLSCHCGGALGNHPISWWLVGRNLLLTALACILLFTPSDHLTLIIFLRKPTLLHEALFPTIVPVVLVASIVLILLWLFNHMRTILHLEG